MGELKKLAYFAEQAHTHATENGVPKESAIQTMADRSKYDADDIRHAYEELYGG